MSFVSINSIGLPLELSSAFIRNGVESLYPWQVECLQCVSSRNGAIRTDQNIVYSAPTSGGSHKLSFSLFVHYPFLGKTLIAELLLLSRLSGVTLYLPSQHDVPIRRQTPRCQIALFVVPYVSLVLEKENYFRKLCRDTGQQKDQFMM